MSAGGLSCVPLWAVSKIITVDRRPLCQRCGGELRPHGEPYIRPPHGKVAQAELVRWLRCQHGHFLCLTEPCDGPVPQLFPDGRQELESPEADNARDTRPECPLPTAADLRDMDAKEVPVRRHGFDFDCGCLGCEDCAWQVEEMGVECVCFECGRVVLPDLGAWTSDRPEDYA